MVGSLAGQRRRRVRTHLRREGVEDARAGDGRDIHPLWKDPIGEWEVLEQLRATLEMRDQEQDQVEAMLTELRYFGKKEEQEPEPTIGPSF